MFSPLSYVHAENYSAVETNVDDVAVNNLAEQLAMIDQATKKDYNGNIQSIDFKMLRNYFGNLEIIDKLEQEFLFNKSNKSWTDCMIDSIKYFVGVNAVNALISGGIKGFIEKKLWKEAAKLILKTFAKSTFTVAGVVALLVYYSDKCWF